MSEFASTLGMARKILALWFNWDKLLDLLILALLIILMAVIASVPLILETPKLKLKQVPAEASVGEMPTDLISIYRAAGERYGIPWSYIMAINKVETDFGRNMGVHRVLSVLDGKQLNDFYAICAEKGIDPTTVLGSQRGAIGFMQFMPSTWQAYKDASQNPPYDPWNAEDAIFAAAKFLASHGGMADIRGALWNYNHDWKYVDRVCRLAQLYAGEGELSARRF